MKKLVLFCLLVSFVLCTSACTKQSTGILFNNAPITKENVMDLTNVFQAGQKIYYLILIPKPSKSRYAYIQIIHKDNDYDRFGYDLFWANTVRLKDEQMYYYDDYVVINKKGSYTMKVYLKDKPQKVFTVGHFYVNN